MSDFQEIEDLRPAPRTTPTFVLWLMTLVVLGGGAFLAWTPPGAVVGPRASAVWLKSEAAKPPTSRPSATVAASAASRAAPHD